MKGQLIHKKCIPCEGGIPPLSDEEIKKYLMQVNGWNVMNEIVGTKPLPKLTKAFKFKDFRAAMAFLRKVEDVAEAEGHHPDFYVHYNHVTFYLWTHAIWGLHENDFILAAKIDALEK